MTFDPDRWLEEGRANKHLLPDGITLPEPEIDYEAWRPALRAHHTSRRWAYDPDVLTDHDKAIIRALVAAYKHAPKATAPDGGWIAWPGAVHPARPTNAKVVVRFSDGRETSIPDDASVYCWEHDGSRSDIVAYRTVRKD